MNEQGTMMNQKQQQQHHLMNLNQQNLMGIKQMNPQSQTQMLPMNRGYGMWPQQPPLSFQKLNLNPNPGSMKPTLSSSFKKQLGPRNNWKGKMINKPNDKWRNEQQKPLMAGGGSRAGGLSGGLNNATVGGGVGIPKFKNYQPPSLNELQHQNQMKTRKFFPKKKFNNKNISMNMNLNMIANNHNFNNSRSAPFAPRNTTSFIIRAKKSGGIASLVSPSPVTPAVLPTPIFSPSREVLVDMAKEEWGVDGYGSMKGLIRLRSPGHELEVHEDEEEEGGSSESDVEEHVEVERRVDHDLSRFEMLYNPSSVNVGNMDFHNMLENRVDDQDSRIAHLEEENLILKERLFLMEKELGDLSRRMQCLERKGNNEEVVKNESENESGSREGHSLEDNNEEFSEDTNGGATFGFEKEGEKNDDTIGEDDKSSKISDVEDKQERSNNDGFVEASNKIDGVFDFVDKTENNDGMIAEADNGDGNEFNNNNNNNNKNNNEAVEVNYIEENNPEEDTSRNMDANASDSNIDVESSRSVMARGDICMGEVGVAKEDSIQFCHGMS